MKRAKRSDNNRQLSTQAVTLAAVLFLFELRDQKKNISQTFDKFLRERGDEYWSFRDQIKHLRKWVKSGYLDF